MPPFDERVESYGASKSHFLLASSSPSRTGILKNRHSTTSLRIPSNLASEEDAANGRHSLAHELAVALMPEPSPGSRLLVEEFGIEYDEGAEGIDSVLHVNGHAAVGAEPTFVDDLGTQSTDFFSNHQLPNGRELDFDATEVQAPAWRQDTTEVLALDLESTDKFLSHLRRLDIDSSGGSVVQPALEKIASDMIRHINDIARDREGQVRALQEYEREFQKIAGEIGGNDVLSELDELPPQDDLSERPPVFEPVRQDGRRLESVAEEEPNFSNDWETDPDLIHLDDEITHSPLQSPVKDLFVPPPVIDGPPTAAKSIPHLSHLRSLTTSLISSLSTISEQAQVNGAATTEAGRKVRALKNKLGGWRSEWDSTEKSCLRIKNWEAGILDGEMPHGLETPGFTPNMRRIDGRKVVKEHLQAFEKALADAALKTQAIIDSKIINFHP